MCYSAMVREDLRKLEREYQAHLSWDDFIQLYRQRNLDFSLSIPPGMDAQLIALGGTPAKEIKLLCDRYRIEKRKRQEQELAATQSAIAELEQLLAAKVTKTNQKKLDAKNRALCKLQTGMAAPSVAAPGSYRIYPYQFAPVIMQGGEQRLIVPMRFRVLPRTGELPDYQLFNARRDQLQVRKTWKLLFGKQHAIFPFERFFEWVGPEDARREITFTPDGYESMWAASLYEECQSRELGLIRSFAMVTDEPPPEVAAAGHDRCPVFIDSALIDKWLQPAGQTLHQLDDLLAHKQPTYFSHMLAA